jgi:hypothetical protein
VSRSSQRLTLALLAAVALTASLVGAAPAASASTAEATFVAKINAARAAAGLPALSVRSDLVTAARSHSATMARQGRLSHSGLSVCCFRALAENVGAGSTVSAVHVSLMGSSGHRANILDPRMRHVGVGVVSSGGTLWVTEIFRAPSGSTGSAQTATPKPTARASTGARAARGTARRAPSFATVLRLRLDRLTDRSSPAADPVASALRWSSTMQTLTAPAR